MARGRRGKDEGFEGGEIGGELRAFQEQLSQRLGTILPLLAVVVVGLWLASGFYIVGPGEQGVVRQFGRFFGTTSSGPNYRLPWPAQAVEVVNVEQIRRIEIGFRSVGGRAERQPDEALMLTGDENIVEAQVIVQYRVKDAPNFVFKVQGPEYVLRAATEVALRSTVGQTKIDDILTEKRGEVQEQTRVFLQTLMDNYQSGILVTDVKLQAVDPPQEVREAFNEVVRAREDREKLENQALAYEQDIIPKARGEAQVIVQGSDAYKQEKIRRSQGDAARFLSVLKEYEKAKLVTRERLYIETMEKVLSRVDKVLIDPQGTSGVLPLLPLRGMEGFTRPEAVPTPASQPQPTPARPAAPAQTPAPAKR